MKGIDIFEWTFTPQNYFEQDFTIELEGQTMTVAEGKARAEVDSDLFDANPDIHRQFHEALNDRLLGVQLIVRESFQLRRTGRTRISEDGTRQLIVEPGSARMTFKGGQPDLQMIDANGEVILCTKRDRIEKKKFLAERVAELRSQDDTLARMIRGFDGAMRNPDNEFTYLYEIADAVKWKFREQPNVPATIGFNPVEWRQFGKLCNELPVWQGRHRGKDFGPMRDATKDEIEKARSIALGIIEAYLRHLEAAGAHGDE